ncbi:MAG: rhodanese-like domain-containing protein [Luteolibacter sp.]
MNSVAQLAAIVAISFTAAGGTYFIKGAPNRTFVCDPASLKPDEVCLQQIPADAKILWVDARSRAQWQKSGLPGSVLWSLDPSEDMQKFEADIAVRIMETPRVIVYCGDENCGLSREVAKRIRALDLGAEVSVLRGGWEALVDAGRIKGSSPKS